MKRCPKIGDRVRYPGGTVVGPCTGIVTAIYEQNAYDSALYDDAMSIDDEQDYYHALRRACIGLAPESEWQVAVKVDIKPEKWCYGESDTFAPEVRELRRGPK